MYMDPHHCTDCPSFNYIHDAAYLLCESRAADGNQRSMARNSDSQWRFNDMDTNSTLIIMHDIYPPPLPSPLPLPILSLSLRHNNLSPPLHSRCGLGSHPTLVHTYYIRPISFPFI